MILAAPASTSAGILTSVATITTAVLVLATAVVGLLSIRRTSKATNAKLDIIHTLVNSTLTASIESDLESTRQSLASMQAQVRLLEAAGQPAAPETIAAIEGAKVKIARLTQVMADRLHSAEAVLAQQA